MVFLPQRKKKDSIKCQGGNCLVLCCECMVQGSCLIYKRTWKHLHLNFILARELKCSVTNNGQNPDLTAMPAFQLVNVAPPPRAGSEAKGLWSHTEVGASCSSLRALQSVHHRLYIHWNYIEIKRHFKVKSRPNEVVHLLDTYQNDFELWIFSCASESLIVNSEWITVTFVFPPWCLVCLLLTDVFWYHFWHQNVGVFYTNVTILWCQLDIQQFSSVLTLTLS